MTTRFPNGLTTAAKGSSLGEFTMNFPSTSWALSSVDLSSKGSIVAGTIEFRIYFS